MSAHILSKELVSSPIAAPHGETVYELVGRGPQSGAIQGQSLAYIEIAPGCASLPHFHSEIEESYYILSGKARMEIDSVEYTLEPGDACLIRPGQSHQIFNDQPAPLSFLAICSPAWYPEDSVFLNA